MLPDFSVDLCDTDNLEVDTLRNYNHADWKYEKIMEQIREFESTLDNEHEIALKLASFGTSITMMIEKISYQNPDILYFYGYVNGNKSTLIQHSSQLNFLITSVEKKDKAKPPRRIGFTVSNEF